MQDAVPLSVIGGSFGGKDGRSVSPERSSRRAGWSLGFSTPACVSSAEMRELACSLESGKQPSGGLCMRSATQADLSDAVHWTADLSDAVHWYS